MGIINDNFLLRNETAVKLYHDFAKDMPIVDYHCHLVPKMIADDYRFEDAYDLFLGGDHYKNAINRHRVGRTVPFKRL